MNDLAADHDKLFEYSDSEYEDDMDTTTKTLETVMHHRSHTAPNINGLRRENAMYFERPSFYGFKPADLSESYTSQQATPKDSANSLRTTFSAPHSWPLAQSTINTTAVGVTRPTSFTELTTFPAIELETRKKDHHQVSHSIVPDRAIDTSSATLPSSETGIRRRDAVNYSFLIPKESGIMNPVTAQRLHVESLDQAPIDCEPQSLSDPSDTVHTLTTPPRNQDDHTLAILTGGNVASPNGDRKPSSSQISSRLTASSEPSTPTENANATPYRPLFQTGVGPSPNVGLGISVPESARDITTNGLTRHRRNISGFGSGEYVTLLEPGLPARIETPVQFKHPKARKKRRGRFLACFRG